DLFTIVVDNRPELNNRPIVQEFRAVYVHEPRRGIAHARNVAVEAAPKLEADFVAFTDDCEVTNYWLDELLRVACNFDADVVRGRTVYTYPEHAAAIRVWRINRLLSVIKMFVSPLALGISITNSLGALAGRGNETTAKRMQVSG